ncbi:hypothetical protein [Piscinibacter sp. HJYY11]|uniref:hypothetical protein n=1 Tax=Piscinibacter sp. HJYY11 TaxID=2801333 RepID=UPI00191CB453|nr:hypothetical protein [Piscinibacter sp. HJYY11]MBL0730758.1 hypothetical protein [Piscinibacter sp. HJYY11]
MSNTIRGGLHAVLAFCAALLCVTAAHAADEKSKAPSAGKTTAKSASSPQTGTQQGKSISGEKAGTATPGSADTDKGGNIAGAKKPSPPKIPQDAAAKKAVQQ